MLKTPDKVSKEKQKLNEIIHLWKRKATQEASTEQEKEFCWKNFWEAVTRLRQLKTHGKKQFWKG
jgi:hypothetical protein